MASIVADAPPTPLPWVQRPWAIALVFGSFVALAPPLLALGQGFRALGDGALGAYMTSWPVVTYLTVLGFTHFFLTFTIYFQAANRRYFASSAANLARFYGVPAAILLFLFLWNGLGAPAALPGAALGLLLGIRLFDFYHLGRQSFGVLQLFKGRSGGKFPAWAKTAENVWFLSWTAGLYVTFLQPGSTFDAAAWPMYLPVAVVGLGALGAFAWACVVAARQGASRRDLATAAGYLALMAAAALPSLVWSGFYVVSLIVHYVEYHLLMWPRCFSTELDEAAWPDRLMSRVRSHPALLYGVLLAFSVLLATMRLAQDTPVVGPTKVLIHLFDGLFVFHYFVEMSIWKFSDPHFRKQLGPLYR